tara:strand:- start:999 stop:1292 length:294 start_codon:yes stop_codon:yes gene_type:complete
MDKTNGKPMEIPYQSAAKFKDSIDGMVTSGAMSKPDARLVLNMMRKPLLDAANSGRKCLESDGNGGFKDANPVDYLTVVRNLDAEYNGGLPSEEDLK